MINGVLNIDKAPGMTSHDVVAKVRRIAGQKRVGHAGTLDPDATGVLLVCLGHATRLADCCASLRPRSLDRSFQRVIVRRVAAILLYSFI